MEDKSVVLKCDCGCGFMEFYHFGEDTFMMVDYYPAGFYAYQNSWRENLQLIWSIITGKKYALYGIVFDQKQIDKLKEFVGGL